MVEAVVSALVWAGDNWAPVVVMAFGLVAVWVSFQLRAQRQADEEMERIRRRYSPDDGAR